MSVRDTSRVSRRHGCANQDGFRRAAKRLHPDALARGDANEADARTDTFVRAVAAYEILSCERRRALYDAERSSRWLRAPSGGFAASAGASETSEDEHDPWASLFRHSEVLRDYRGAVHALVPRAALRRELYTALARVLGGPQLDVEAVLAGARWPKYFEAEERASVAAAERGDDPAAFRTQGVDLMHVVSGRTLLAAVRERRVEAIEWTHTLALRGDANGDGDGDANGDERDANGDEIENDPGDERPPSPGTPPPSRPSPDAVLELVIDGRVAATATRLVPGGDVTVRANVVEGDPDAPPRGVPPRRRPRQLGRTRPRRRLEWGCRLGCRRRLGGCRLGARVRARARAERRGVRRLGSRRQFQPRRDSRRRRRSHARGRRARHPGRDAPALVRCDARDVRRARDARVDASRRGLARRAPIRPSRERRVVFRTSSGTPPRDATRP